MENCYVSQREICGICGHIRRPQDPTVVFINDRTELCRLLIDREGNIRNFPGVAEDERITRELGHWCITPVAKYSVSFRQKPHCIRMVWTVRPDGRFFMDEDGFGDEGFVQVRLYADINEQGQYDGPFRLHSIGYQNYEGEEL